MISLTFIEPSGLEHRVRASIGKTLMQAAVESSLPGIPADCGGACSCGTCHVQIDQAWLERVPGSEAFEDEMLDCVGGRSQTSRLSCQIPLTPQLDGMVVHIPAPQW